MLSAVALLLIGATLASAQITVNQACNQDIEVQSIIVGLGILGVTYYEQMRYPFIYEEDSRCNTGVFSYDPSSLINLSGKVVFSLIYTNGTAWSLEGKVVFPNPTLAQPSITIDGFPGTANVSIIAVDSDLNYGVAYGCTDVGNGSSIQYLWILTKEVNPSSSVLDSALTAIQRQNIDTTPLLRSNQTNCG